MAKRKQRLYTEVKGQVKTSYPNALLPSRGVDRDSTRAELEAAAREMHCDPAELTRLIDFVSAIEEAADRLQMSPPEVTNGCMTMLASALKFCPEDDRPDALTSIFALLWDALGLKRDT
tara:strand:+ start:2709 stop:3065 length:357 start_codon:yes stop_codon:yes gene_type:complete